MKEKDAAKLYVRELLGTLALYTVVLMVAIRFGKPMEPGVLRTAVLVSPMVPFLLAVWVIVRQFARMDEYQRMRQLENMAIAGAVTVGWTFTYGFLETAGYPHLSMFTIWPVYGAVWGGVTCLRQVLDR